MHTNSPIHLFIVSEGTLSLQTPNLEETFTYKRYDRCSIQYLLNKWRHFRKKLSPSSGPSLPMVFLSAFSVTCSQLGSRSKWPSFGQIVRRPVTAQYYTVTVTMPILHLTAQAFHHFVSPQEGWIERSKIFERPHLQNFYYSTLLKLCYLIIGNY